MSSIYKILTIDQFEKFKQTQYFSGNEHDLRDGFIHMVTSDLLAEVIRKHYSHCCEVVIVEFDEEIFDTGIKWERARDGYLYPHLYNLKLVFSQVKSIRYKESI